MMPENKVFKGLKVTGEDASGRVLFTLGKRPPEPDCAVEF